MAKKKKEKKDQGIFREYFELITEVLVFVFFIMTFLLMSEVIPTGSMKNNLLIGDHLLLNRVAYLPHKTLFDRLLFPPNDIRRGSIVAFKAPPEMDKQYVKRVIALPRERIRIEQGQVYINDRPLSEPWITNNSVFNENNNALYFTVHGNYPERTVPDGHYFVMGDNRNNSLDSRSWGFLPGEYVLGKPWRIYWSYESTSEDYLTPGIKHKIRGIFRTIKNFFRKTRWERTFLKIR